MTDRNDMEFQEKLKKLDEKHERKIKNIKEMYESKCDDAIKLLRWRIKDCVHEILSYYPDAKKEQGPKEMKEIEEIKKLKLQAEKISIKTKYNTEITDESLLFFILKFRGGHGTANMDVYNDNIRRIWYGAEHYTLDEYLEIISKDYWLNHNEKETLPDMFSKLLWSWYEKWYNLYDLFFNDKIQINEKHVINMLLQVYEGIQKSILPYYSYALKHNPDKEDIFILEQQKELYENIFSKMTTILETQLWKESPENIKNMKILLSKQKLYEEEEREIRYVYDNLQRKVDNYLADGIDYLLDLRDNYKSKKWSENQEEQRRRIDEIFSEILTWSSVLDTWFLYKNAWCNFYKKIENEESYQKIYDEWKKIISDNSERVQKYLQEDSVLLDYWCYLWDKAKSLLQSTKKIKYLPVDVDSNMIRQSSENLKSLGIEVEEGIISSWDITDPIAIPNQDNNLTYFFTWWSIWNYSEEKIHSILSWTFNPEKWSYLIMDYYKTPKSLDDIKNLLKSYDNKVTEDRFINWLLNLWFQPRFFESAWNEFYWTIDELKNIYKNHDSFNNLKLFLGTFLKFSVRYEFHVDDKMYYAELWDNSELNIFRCTWNSAVKCGADEIRGYLSIFNEFPWQIVEWFTWIKDSETEHIIEANHAKLKYRWFELSPVFEPDSPVKSKKQVWIKSKIWDDYKFIPVNFKKWEFYPVEISRRFSDDEIKELAEKAGRTVELNINDDKYKYLNLLIAKSSKNKH